MAFPNLFLLGAPKCATTSLYDLLSRHPQIFCPSVKEPGYFTRDEVRADIQKSVAHLKDEQGYLDLFSSAQGGNSVTCDGSTSYLRSPAALEQIAALGSDVKAIAVYRDPVELVSSYFTFLRTEAWEDQPNLEAAWAVQSERRAGSQIPQGARRKSSVIYSDVAMLGRQITAAQTILGKRLKVYDMKEVTQDIARVSRDIQTWIGVTTVDLGGLPSLNPARAPRNRMLNNLTKNPPAPVRAAKNMVKAAMGVSSLGIARRVGRLNETQVTRKVSDDLRNEMRAYFHDDVCLLEDAVGRDLRKVWGWI